MDAMAKVDSGRKHRGEKRRKNSRSKVISLVGSRRMTEKNYHGDKCAEKDDHSFGIREEKAEDGRESADYKQKRVMDINRVTDKNHKSRNKDLEAEYRFDCEDEEVQKQDKSSTCKELYHHGRRRTEEMDHPDSKYTEKDGEEGHKKVDSKQKRKADLNKENNRKRRKKDMESAYDCDIEAKEDQKEKKSSSSMVMGVATDAEKNERVLKTKIEEKEKEKESPQSVTLTDIISSFRYEDRVVNKRLKLAEDIEDQRDIQEVEIQEEEVVEDWLHRSSRYGRDFDGGKAGDYQSSSGYRYNRKWCGTVRDSDRWSGTVSGSDRWSGTVRGSDRWSGTVSGSDRWSGKGVRGSDRWNGTVTGADRSSGQ